jgi:hypothetical protein
LREQHGYNRVLIGAVLNLAVSRGGSCITLIAEKNAERPAHERFRKVVDNAVLGPPR